MKGKREMKNNKKGMTALVALVLILCCAVGGTLAWLVTTSGPVVNTFTPGSVTTYVDEKFENGTKSDVKVENTGNVDAYIRAAIVVNWINDQGEVYAQPVKDSDYEIELNIGTGEKQWTKGTDGFYYYNNSVAPGVQTDVLIKSLTKTDSAVTPAGYDLQVTILAEGIQAEGMGANDAQAAFKAAYDSAHPDNA